MKWVIFSGIATTFLGGAFYLNGGAVGENVYGISAEQAHAKLAAKSITPGSSSPFRSLPAEVETTSPTTLKWNVISADHGYTCKAQIEATAENQSRITPTCTAGQTHGGESAEIAVKLRENAMKEFIDSTLNGRPYDAQRVEKANGATVMANIGKIHGAVNDEIGRVSEQMDEMAPERPETDTEPTDYDRTSEDSDYAQDEDW